MANKELEVKSKIDLGQLFKISRMKEKIKPTVPHKHDAYYEIILLTDGAGVHSIDEREYDVNPPVAFFLKPGQVHCWEFTKIPKGYVCIFKDVFLNESFEGKRHIYNFPPMLYLKNNLSGLQHDFEQLQSTFEKDAGNTAIIRSYLNIIILKLVGLGKNETAFQTSLNPLVSSFKNLVEKNQNEQMDLDFYAEQLNVTKRKLSETCKKELGRPATSILNEHLIMASKRLLKHTIKTISEIAYQLNFTDPSYFVKFFKANTSLTPGEYRNLIK